METSKVKSDDSSSGIIEKGINILKKLNMFTVFQVGWLIEIYYLGLNALLNSEVAKEMFPDFELPYIAEKYNSLILDYFSKWENFIFVLAIGMFVCGFTFCILKAIPGISNYNIINMYSEYGGYAGAWLMLIYASYWLYSKLGALSLFVPMVIYLIIEGLKKLKILKQ